MSSELWQQAKEALAEAMALAEDERSVYLTELQAKSAEVHDEVVSLMSSQAAADQAGFLDDAEDTLDQFHTATYDPARTRENFSIDGRRSVPKSTGLPTNLVGDDYDLEKKIGQGGMGVVYKAYHRSLRRTVALKIITGGGLRDEIDIARFHLEAEAAARLDHPGIIPVYDVGEYNGNHYYAMAYIEGPSLSKFVGTNAKLLPPRRTAELIEQVCHAVQYAHDRAVIHRDLKPANIMLENGKIPRLADFGLAKNMHEDDGLTMTGQVMGTPSYMAPEQAAGKLDEISNRTDVYSLGATLYALLAGKPPFSGGTMLETIRQVVRTEAESLTHASRSVPRDLQTICEKCLAKSPADRYASAADVADDLRRYLDGFPISARPLAPWARSMRWCQRNPVEAALLAMTATALIVGTIVSVRFGLEANRALTTANQNARQLRSAIKDTFVFASEDVLAQEPGMQAARAVLLKAAQQYYTELVELTPGDADSQRELAEAQFMLSKVQMALGQDAEAGETLTKALNIQKTLTNQNPRDAVTLTALAKSHNQLATLAQKNWQGLTQLRDMGKLSAKQAAEADQQLDGWQQHSAEVVRLRKLVVELEPENLESRRLLASAMMNEGNVVGIRGYARNNLSEQDLARKKILEAQEVRLAVLQDFPEEALMRRDLARGYYNLANTELRAADQELDDQPYRQRLQLSVADLTQAIEAYQKLFASEQVLDTRLELAQCFRERASAHFRLVQKEEDGEAEEAANDFQHAEKRLKALTDRSPNVYRYRIVLAETQYNLCSFWFVQQQEERAVIQLSKCRATLLQGIRIDPRNLDAAEQFVRFTQNIVEPLLEMHNFDLADQLLQEALQELLALQQESAEYSGLQPSIETLESLARKVQSLREEAETPKDVT